jgi:hypothetical protein
MASRQLGLVVEQLHRLTEHTHHEHLSDQQLVNPFVRWSQPEVRPPWPPPEPLL